MLTNPTFLETLQHFVHIGGFFAVPARGAEKILCSGLNKRGKIL